MALSERYAFGDFVLERSQQRVRRRDGSNLNLTPRLFRALLTVNNELLELWSSQSWTVVFVTHSVYEAVYLSTRIVVMAARPGRIVAEHAIAAPYPRDGEFRTSALYNETCRVVSRSLAQAMEGQ